MRLRGHEEGPSALTLICKRVMLARFIHSPRLLRACGGDGASGRTAAQTDELLATEGELIEPCGARARDVRELSIERSERRALTARQSARGIRAREARDSLPGMRART